MMMCCTDTIWMVFKMSVAKYETRFNAILYSIDERRINYYNIIYKNDSRTDLNIWILLFKLAMFL